MLVKSLRLTTMLLGASNSILVLLGAVLVRAAYPSCASCLVTTIALVSAAAAVKIGTMVKTGIAQEATAKIITESPMNADVLDAVIRHERRVRYKTWLWWSRFAMVITVLQFLGSAYLLYCAAKYISHTEISNDCSLGIDESDGWKRKALASYIIIACSTALAQCFTGSDVLNWRFFYATQDDAWRVHYHEVFDHGIREALCCLGRVEYLRVLEEDEVYSGAQLLGDLVAYRASGTGHLEFLAGLALLQNHSQSNETFENFVEAPAEYLKEAASLHIFAEAAYTGPLLDIGRTPFIFPCVWFYRQGSLTPWTRNRRPIVDGDNWWRGHAAAFLKFINLPSEALRRGRVRQKKCEAAYFVVVLHQLRSVVISVRGTETPEDLITDGLGRDCPLSLNDLDGLINSNIPSDVKRTIQSSFPHYGHAGIVEAARDLYMQVEGNPVERFLSDDEIGSEAAGFLSSLLGTGCECDGYRVCIVGHSLGGAIAAMLGLRLYSRFPNLHVYSYGPLPCVDSVIADACSDFITSIVHSNEFSARLSVGSILRLRAAAIMAMSEDSKTDAAVILRLACRFLCASKLQIRKTKVKDHANSSLGTSNSEDANRPLHSGNKEQDQEFSLWNETENQEFYNPFAAEVKQLDDNDSMEFHNPFANEIEQLDDAVSQFMETVPRSGQQSAEDPSELFLPGLVIHLVPEKRNVNLPIWQGLRAQRNSQTYKAFVVNRKCFRDIVVSPDMFLDHLPWRCRAAMQMVMKAQTGEVPDISQLV